VVTRDRHGRIRTVAGVDVGFEDDGRTTRAAVTMLTFPGLEPVAEAISRCPASFSYVPGYLSFRELPAVLEALGRLDEYPDLVLCDGQGLAHPRRLGLACHLGVLRTRTRVSPVFVSIGHRVSLESAIDLTLRCTTRYRLPETTRHAHRLTSG